MATSILAPPPTLVFQPIVDLKEGRILGYEALARLLGKEDGGFQALRREAIRRGVYLRTLEEVQARALFQGLERPENTLLFVNLDLRLISVLRRLLEAKPELCRGLVVELSERSRALARWEKAVASLRRLGVGIALDDWGVGVSDPLRLIRLSPDWVKIDLALTARVGDDPSTVRLLEFLIAWSEKAEVRLIAEGVARREQLERLASLGIRYVQGFFLAPPEPSWRTGIDLPLRSARIRLGRRSLGLAHPYPLREEDLTLIARKAPLLAAVVPRAVEAALAHLEHIPALPRGNVAEFRTALCRHFARILQGELDESDVLLLERLAEESLAQGLELGWHVLLHRHILEAVSSQALDLPEATLGALDALLTWHLSALAALIAEHLSRDEETGLLTRNLFLLRGKALVAELKEAWLVVLLRVSTPRHESLPAVIRLVGALASGGGLGGRIGEREFALLVPFRRELLPTLRRAVHEARRRLSPARLDVGLALSRRDGDDFVALYLRAYQRLAGRHHAP